MVVPVDYNWNSLREEIKESISSELNSLKFKGKLHSQTSVEYIENTLGNEIMNKIKTHFKIEEDK